jgi:hypothetical protein
MGQIPECEDGKADGAASFDDEEISPILETSVLDLENAEGEKPAEC